MDGCVTGADPCHDAHIEFNGPTSRIRHKHTAQVTIIGGGLCVVVTRRSLGWERNRREADGGEIEGQGCGKEAKDHHLGKDLRVDGNQSEKDLESFTSTSTAPPET